MVGVMRRMKALRVRDAEGRALARVSRLRETVAEGGACSSPTPRVARGNAQKNPALYSSRPTRRKNDLRIIRTG